MKSIDTDLNILVADCLANCNVEPGVAVRRGMTYDEGFHVLERFQWSRGGGSGWWWVVVGGGWWWVVVVVGGGGWWAVGDGRWVSSG